MDNTHADFLGVTEIMNGKPFPGEGEAGRRGGTHRQLGLTLALLLGSEALLLGSLGPAPLLEETEG